jgi:hypothetical protein
VKCGGLNKAGEPCKANALKDSDPPRCLAHSDATLRESVGFVPDNGHAGRKPVPKPTELMTRKLEELVEQNIEQWAKAYVDGLNADRAVVVGNGPTAHVENVPDIPTRINAAEKLNDRILGKPRQSVEHTGADGGPIQTANLNLSVLSAVELRALRALVEKAGGG